MQSKYHTTPPSPAKDPLLGPNIYTGQFTTACNSSSWAYDFLFWPPWTPGTHVVHRPILFLCSPGCPGTHGVDQAGLGLRDTPAGIKGVCCDHWFASLKWFVSTKIKVPPTELRGGLGSLLCCRLEPPTESVVTLLL